MSASVIASVVTISSSGDTGLPFSSSAVVRSGGSLETVHRRRCSDETAHSSSFVTAVYPLSRQKSFGAQSMTRNFKLPVCAHRLTGSCDTSLHLTRHPVGATRRAYSEIPLLGRRVLGKCTNSPRHGVQQAHKTFHTRQVGAGRRLAHPPFSKDARFALACVRRVRMTVGADSL